MAGQRGNALSGTSATCAVTYSATGSHTITAKYLGDYQLLGLAHLVEHHPDGEPAATTTAVGSSVNPSVVGQAVTYTATVAVTAPGSGTPTGNIEFLDGGTAISTCGGATRQRRSAAPVPPAP